MPAHLLATGTLVAILVQGLGIGLPAVLLSAGFAGAMWLTGGTAHGTKHVLARATIQQRVPARVHGRAFGAYNGTRNAAELVAIAMGGVLVPVVGARVTLAIAGGVPVLVALAGLARGRPPPPGYRRVATGRVEAR